jgi:hypothetical protein
MPSARALLVALLLTEPPYGCLGPSGNDRYRKRLLRSQTAGLGKSTAKSQRLFRNESATSRRVRAGAIGGSTAMTRTAFCRKSLRVPGVRWLGSSALGTRDRGGQITKKRSFHTLCTCGADASLAACGYLIGVRRGFCLKRCLHTGSRLKTAVSRGNGKAEIHQRLSHVGACIQLAVLARLSPLHTLP